jgi:hypothetical protein
MGLGRIPRPGRARGEHARALARDEVAMGPCESASRPKGHGRRVMGELVWRRRECVSREATDLASKAINDQRRASRDAQANRQTWPKGEPSSWAMRADTHETRAGIRATRADATETRSSEPPTRQDISARRAGAQATGASAQLSEAAGARGRGAGAQERWAGRKGGGRGGGKAAEQAHETGASAGWARRP